MPSKKSSSADNQQERQKVADWIVGFTDGEGCFTVSILRNPTTRRGWQIFPEFVITQGKKSLPALKLLKRFFKCGVITINRRRDNHNENLYRYCVRSVKELSEKIIPFFMSNRLRTAKKRDFLIFSKVVALMKQGKHLERTGFDAIVKIVSTMNRKKVRQLLYPQRLYARPRNTAGKI